MKRKKSSVFRGVSLSPSHRNEWRVDVGGIGYTDFFATEMEAVAHYNAVACVLWPDPDDIHRLMTEINNVWKGRPTPPRGWNGRGQRVVDIDHNFCTIVDDQPGEKDGVPVSIYTTQKDFVWFVRHNHAMRIVACWIPDEVKAPPRFTYVTLEDVVLGEMNAVHLNGHTLDNRRSNLAARKRAEQTGAIWSSRPLTSDALRDFRKRKADPARLAYLQDLKVWEEYARFQRGETNTWVGHTPYDPRKKPENRRFLE